MQIDYLEKLFDEYNLKEYDKFILISKLIKELSPNVYYDYYIVISKSELLNKLKYISDKGNVNETYTQLLIPKTNFIQISLLALILVFNLGGNIQAVNTTPPGLTTQFDEITQIDHHKIDELIGVLKTNNLTRGYSNYWVSYPLAFLTGEQILFVPRLPYHEDFRYTARDDRYPPYYENVQKATDIGYITTNHEDLDNYLRDSFRSENITWSEKTIGDYQIFYHLSQDIHPQEIGLGTTTKP